MDDRMAERLAERRAQQAANAPRAERCKLCGGLGWILDCNDIGRPGPRMVEFIACPIPDFDCPTSGQEIQGVCFKGPVFTHVSRHPASGIVMRVSK
jgi:hypothetical protein